MRQLGIKSTQQFASMPQSKFDKFIEALDQNLYARRGGSIVKADREERDRRRSAKAAEQTAKEGGEAK